MTELLLKAHTRQVKGKKVKKLRNKQLLPAVVYGQGLEPQSLELPKVEFEKVYRSAGSSTLVDLQIDEQKPLKVIIQTPQYDFVNNEPIHVDFKAVKLTEKMEATIPLRMVGVSPAVEELEGNLIASKDEVSVRCLPTDLVSEIEVDISSLKTFEDQIRIKDLQVPNTIEILDDPDELVAAVEEPISEEELEAELAEDKEAEEAAVEELGKAEEAQGEEEKAQEESATVEKE